MIGLRPFFLLFCLILLWGPVPGECQEFVVGRVLAVDREDMVLVVSVETAVSGNRQDTTTETVMVRPAPENRFAGKGETVLFPSCVVVGDRVRLWGERVPGTPPLFLATDIRGCRGGGCMDPTGVHLRLLRARGNRQGFFSTEPSGDQGSGSVNHGGHGGAGHGGNGDGNGGGNGGGGNGGGGDGGGGGGGR